LVVYILHTFNTFETCVYLTTSLICYVIQSNIEDSKHQRSQVVSYFLYSILPSSTWDVKTKQDTKTTKQFSSIINILINKYCVIDVCLYNLIPTIVSVVVVVTLYNLPVGS